MNKLPSAICIALLLLGGCVANQPQGRYAPAEACVVANCPQGVPCHAWNVFCSPCLGYNATCWHPWPVECEGCPTFPVEPGNSGSQLLPVPLGEPALSDSGDEASSACRIRRLPHI